jgi:hypothetical protein
MRVPTIDPIEELAVRKFQRLTLSKSILRKGGRATPEQLQEMREMEAEKAKYVEELKQKTPEEISELYATMQQEKEESRRNAIKEQESRLFFNLPTADADFDYWSKAAYWTLDEANALSFGKNPTIVNWAAVERYTKRYYDKNQFEREPSSFALEYGRRRELISRAKTFGQLFEPAVPTFFFGWLEQNQFSFPNGLKELVVARGGKVGSWKLAYEALEKANNENIQAYNALKTEAQTRIAEANTIIESLREELNLLKERISLASSPLPEPTLTTRERETLLKLIIGMAIGGYSYDPKASKNPSITDIISDLESLGLEVSDDTLRAKLKAATMLLPPVDSQ